MNIPQLTEATPAPVVANEVTVGELIANVLTDFVMAGAYVLVLFIIVFLNRNKHVSIFVPQKTYAIVFGSVFLLSFSGTIAAVFFTSVTVSVVYKLLISVLMMLVVLAIWRVLPRDVDAHEQHRMRLENAELQRAIAEREVAEAKLVEALDDVDGQVATRTNELAQVNLALEKEVIERKLAEERAAESKRRLDELIMRTNTAVLFVDSDGSVLECNHALAQLVGRGTIEELVGRKLSRLLGLRNEHALVHFTSETLRFGTFSSEFDAAPPARGVIHIEANGAASVLNGRPCIMALFRDVTERKNAEKELLQSREALTAALEVARKANATKSDFLAKMNHELRTPLNGIIGLAEVLRQKATANQLTVRQVQELNSNIHQSGTHLLSLVDDLLDLSRIDGGNRSFTPLLVGVRAEIDVAMITLASIADKKKITIKNDCDAELEWVVDQRAFKQIIINLVNNAVKFSPEGSTVLIRVQRSAEAMALQICDEGPGISDEDRKRILTPFGRGEFAESQKIDGVGLGLTIVSELLKLQGGKLTIESERGKGSIFTAIFPVGKAAEQESVAAQ